MPRKAVAHDLVRRQNALVPLDRYGRPDEVAALVAFAAGPES
jgi:NAD(P)-dependent dehydrogenase (short-subunit alcohol dehydrogenase family)